jgi:hypothetical protein
VGKAAAAVVLNVLILAMLAGVHFRFLQLIFAEGARLSLLAQMLLATIVTLVFLMVGRPMRRMWQMIQLSVGAAGAAVPGAGGGLFSKFRGRKGQQRTPQDEFWENLRDTDLAEDASPDATPTRRPRPEATNPITATAERLDTRTTVAGGAPLALPPARGRLEQTATIDPMLPAAGPADRTRASEQLVVRRSASRVVDTVPVTDRGWDRGEDSVLVPSRVNRRAETSEAEGGGVPSPRPADIEEVGGRQVHVVYRPSRGLEVADSRRMPLKDGPRYTDTVVR